MIKLIFSNHFLLILIPLLVTFGCSEPKNRISYNSRCFELENGCINNNIKVEIMTNKGRVIVELNAINAPLTSTNFLMLVNRGLYDGTSFDRSIKSPYPFLVQGGHKEFKYDFENNKKSYLDKRSISIKSIPLEIKLKGEDYPRYNQTVLRADNFKRILLKHERGSIAMARSQSVDSARIKFYITLKNLPELDGRYAVFGKVLKGMDVIDSIKEGDLILKVKEVRK